jgi:DNA-directed RNA polymerase subunit RPC12/RpoP
MLDKKSTNTVRRSFPNMELESAVVLNCTYGEKNHCAKCGKTFDKPKIVQYLACPHCETKIEQQKKSAGCQYWFGYLSQKDKDESVPQDCVECEKVLDCMLRQYNGSPSAVNEIKKWYPTS